LIGNKPCGQGGSFVARFIDNGHMRDSEVEGLQKVRASRREQVRTITGNVIEPIFLPIGRHRQSGPGLASSSSSLATG
jgi:hypothetical protein